MAIIMHDWYDIYQSAWVVFYSMSIGASCFLMGASFALVHQRWTKLWAGLFALLMIGAGPFVLSAPLVAGSWLGGGLLRSRRRLFPAVAVLGLAGVALDSLWPSKMPFLSHLTTNRPTLLRLAMGIAGGDEFFRGGTMYSRSEPVAQQQATLFGKYPIRVGLLDQMDNTRFEFQVLLTAAAFLVIFLLCRMSATRRHLGRHPPIEIAAVATLVILLPIHPLIPIVLLLGSLIGKLVNRTGILSPFLNKLTEARLVVGALLLLVLYHAAFASTLIDGFVGGTDTNWDAFYASAGMIAIIFGAIVGRAADLGSARPASGLSAYP